jgi:hypothetical protein
MYSHSSVEEGSSRESAPWMAALGTLGRGAGAELVVPASTTIEPVCTLAGNGIDCPRVVEGKVHCATVAARWKGDSARVVCEPSATSG